MKHPAKIVLATLVLASTGWLGSLSANALVASPEKVFSHGLRWTDRANPDNKGVMQLNSGGGALIHWNGHTYRGHWEKVDDYHVRTMWEDGGPPGSIWSLRETGDSAVPFVASRAEP